MRTEIVVPKGTIPGTPEYIESNIRLAVSYAKFLKRDAEPFLRFCRQLRECQAWKTWLKDEPKTWERFCRECIGVEPAFEEYIDMAMMALDPEFQEIPDLEEFRAS